MSLEVIVAADPPRPCPGTDPFERLHDSIVLHILNFVSDIKTLGRCTVVSKRFNGLVPVVENVTVKVDCVVSGEDSGLNIRFTGLHDRLVQYVDHLVQYVVSSLAEPLLVLQHMFGPKKRLVTAVLQRSPGEVLKNFKAIQKLRIELPGGELGVKNEVLLKWKADFGSTLESCVMLGAAAYSKLEAEREENSDNVAFVGEDDSDSLPESFYTDDWLLLGVLWTISSLIAASARHYLLQQIISEHPTLRSLILTDTDGQGMLCMGREQLEEFRHKPFATSALANRTQVPALNMKLWYAPNLELPGGFRLKGATLATVKPSDQVVHEEVDTRCFVLPGGFRLTGATSIAFRSSDQVAHKEVDGFEAGAFEEPFRTAVSLLAKSRTYMLKMNSC